MAGIAPASSWTCVRRDGLMAGRWPWRQAPASAAPRPVAPAAAAGPSTVAAQAEFLRTAKVVRSRSIGKGVTAPQRLTLTDGTVTHDAAFQSVNERKSQADFGDQAASSSTSPTPTTSTSPPTPSPACWASTG